MAKPKKAASLNLSLLASVVAATVNGGDNPFVFVSDADAAPLLAHVPPLVEQNPGMTDASGSKATRATDDGVKYSAANPATSTEGAAPAASKEPKEKPVFNIVKGVSIPDIKRGGGAAVSIYPFETMEAGDSFFVPATEDRKDPAKALASTVSSATRRFAVQDGMKADPKDSTKQVPNMKQTRKFVVRAMEDGAPWGDQFKGQKGAAIFREE